MKNTIIEYFVDLVKIDSESKNEKEIAIKLAKDLENLGAKIKFDKANKQTSGNIGNLYAYFSGNIDKAPLLFNAHMDTVTPGNRVKPQISDKKITSDGNTILGSDDKSGIAQIIYAIKDLKDKNEDHAPIEVLFTISEEIGLLGAKNVNYAWLNSNFGFAMDAHNVGEITIGAPAQNSIKFIIHGLEAHAGVAPQEGINAIKIAAEAIAKMPMGKIDDETTSNVGIIEGGKATNIVPNKVVIKAEARSHNSEKLKEITDEMTNILTEQTHKYKVKDFTASVDIEIEKEYDSFHLEPEDKIVKLSKKASDNCNLKFSAQIAGGGSDANIFNANGLPMVIAGTGMNKVHTVNEFMKIEDLESGRDWIREIIKEYSKNS